MFRKVVGYGLVLATVFAVMTGCRTTPPIQRMQAVLDAAPDAVDFLVNELKTKKIIVIGESHDITNEEIFLAEHLQDFYDAGVRYIFSEGAGFSVSDIPGNENYYFRIYYPWEPAGNRFEHIYLARALQSLPDITIVNPESGLEYKDFSDDGSPLPDLDWVNYRDTIAAKNIIQIMDTTKQEEKAIILYGGSHAEKKIAKMPSMRDPNKRITRIPLGYLLTEHYGSAVGFWSFLMPGGGGAYNFDFVPGETQAAGSVIEYWKAQEKKWSMVNQGRAKAVLSKQLTRTRLDYFAYKPMIKQYDGFITQDKLYYGTAYNYVPIDENLTFMFQMVEYFESIVKELGIKDPIPLDWQTSDWQYLTAIYYTKLYFGDHFNYTFWKTSDDPGLSLREALAELEAYAFAEGKRPSEFITFQHSEEDMREYHKYALCSGINNSLDETGVSIQKNSIEYLEAARAIFPEDIWSLYWMGFCQMELGMYAEGLASFQELFKHTLSLCFESLPLAYQKAAYCAAALGNQELANQYTAFSERLYNEHGIDVSQSYYSGALYKGTQSK